MPTFTYDELNQIANRILHAAGVSTAEAEIVAGELCDANIVGHDSHGAMRLMQYVSYIEQGIIRPGAEFEVVINKPAFAVADAHFAFGQVATIRALDLALEKARAAGTATVMIRNCNHIGRLGSYTERASKEGFAALMTVNAPGPGGVAPFGGMDRRLGTNPISLAAPWRGNALVLDMTTSATAEGKLRVAFQKGETVSEGCILDPEGNPSTDPADFYREPGGSILPLGGIMGHKGFGLSVMIDVFAGILSGSGVCRKDLPPGANGVWIYLLDIEQFLPREEYNALLETYVEWIKSSRRLPGVDEILLPGEIEQCRQNERRAAGVNIPDETWRQITALAERLGASLPV